MTESLFKKKLDPLSASTDSQAEVCSFIPDDNKIGVDEKKNKKNKKNKKDKIELGEKGSIRGIETLFRGSCHTQLALTALADNKANIMISINGFILSIIIASSGIILDFSPYLLLPVGVLLLTSLIAMFLAIRAARPKIIQHLNPPSKQDFITGKANILFFADFITLSRDDYLDVVNQIMNNKTLTYRHIAEHSHGLGIGLVRKFKLLCFSYDTFIIGLAISTSFFLIIYLSLNLNMGFIIPKVEAFEPQKFPVFNKFRSLHAINEVSGVQQLPDGRFLTVNDEKKRPFNILTLDDLGQFSATPLYPQKQFLKNSKYKDFRNLADLEAIDIDNQGYIYAITSHSFTHKGEKRKSRKKLTRFQMEGQTIIEPVVIKTLKQAIANQHAFLAAALKEENSKSKRGFNIEGLSLNPTQDKLLLGLRSPLKDNKAIVLTLDNINDLFDFQVLPNVAPQLHFLDLGGESIRSLNYIPRLQGYLVISGPVDNSNNIEFKLWLWNVEKNTTRRVTVKGLSGFEEAEGVAEITWNGEPRLLIMTDGTLTGLKSTRYIILKYEQLHIEPQ